MQSDTSANAILYFDEAVKARALIYKFLMTDRHIMLLMTGNIETPISLLWLLA